MKLLKKIKYYIKSFYYKHNHKIYICHICGKIEAPYSNDKYFNLEEDFSWEYNKKLKGWECGHCSFEGKHDPKFLKQSYTETQWKAYVIEKNNELLEKLKKRL